MIHVVSEISSLCCGVWTCREVAFVSGWLLSTITV
jgi:hypothetical protein